MTDRQPVTVTLKHPVGDIAAVTLRPPGSGDLRGCALADVMRMEPETICKVVGRIASPVLTPAQFWQLAPGDLLALSLEVVGFFELAEDPTFPTDSPPA